jgi:hypothetical protein
MTLAIVIRDVGSAGHDLLVGVAGADEHHASADDGGAHGEPGDAAAFGYPVGDRCPANLHRRLLAPPVSPE